MSRWSRPKRVFAATLAIMAGCLWAGAAAASPIVGTARTVVRDVRGELASDIRTILVNTEVFLNEDISTGPSSAARIVFLDGTVLSLAEDSRLKLTTLVFGSRMEKGHTSGQVVEDQDRSGGYVDPVRARLPVRRLGKTVEPPHQVEGGHPDQPAVEWGGWVHRLADGGPGECLPQTWQQFAVQELTIAVDTVVFDGDTLGVAEPDEGVAAGVPSLDALQQIPGLQRGQPQIGRDRCVQVRRYVEYRFHLLLVVLRGGVPGNEKTHLVVFGWVCVGQSMSRVSTTTMGWATTNSGRSIRCSSRRGLPPGGNCVNCRP